MDKKWCVVLFLYAYHLSDNVSCHTVDAGTLSREKRGMYCLTVIINGIKKAVVDGLKEIHKKDPEKLGNDITNITSRLSIQGVMMTGLSSLTNVTEIQSYCHGTMITFNTILTMENLEISTNWTRRGYFFNQTGSLKMKVKVVNFHLVIHLNTSEIISYKLDHSLIWNQEDVTWEFNSGYSYLDRFVSSSITFLFNTFRQNIDWGLRLLITNQIEYNLDVAVRILNESPLT